jgi:hypothetical protein
VSGDHVEEAAGKAMQETIKQIFSLKRSCLLLIHDLRVTVAQIVPHNEVRYPEWLSWRQFMT